MHLQSVQIPRFPFEAFPGLFYLCCKEGFIITFPSVIYPLSVHEGVPKIIFVYFHIIFLFMRSTAAFMKKVSSVYTLLINTTYLSPVHRDPLQETNDQGISNIHIPDLTIVLVLVHM